MGRGRSGRRGPQKPAAKKARAVGKGRGASALLKRSRNAKALRNAATFRKTALRAAPKSSGGSSSSSSNSSSGTNADIAREYAMLEERLVGTKGVSPAQKRAEAKDRGSDATKCDRGAEGESRCAKNASTWRLIAALAAESGAKSPTGPTAERTIDG
eukprot:scaffold53_cov193-Pinguiococcus_pyrenoidosus.AAC.20